MRKALTRGDEIFLIFIAIITRMITIEMIKGQKMVSRSANLLFLYII